MPHHPFRRRRKSGGQPLTIYGAAVVLIAGSIASGLVSAPPASGGAGGLRLIVGMDRFADMAASRAALEPGGGRPVHVFPPDAAVAYLPDGGDDALANRGGGLSVYGDGEAPADADLSSDAVRAAALYWRARAAEQFGQSWKAADAAGASPEATPENEPGDIFLRPTAAEKGAEPPPAESAPPGASFWDLSEFMLGDVSVGVVFVESNGAVDPNTETWTQALQDDVIAEIPGAFDWWLSHAGTRPLTFNYKFDTGSTGYEPITRTQPEEGLWIAQVMASLGHASGDYFTRAAAHDNALRDEQGTDWGITIFVVNSKVDADGRFADGRFAYAYLGGPFLIVTYDNNGWGIGNMDAVVAHEMGHSFYALDEYPTANIPCAQETGYLRVKNGNSALGGCPLNDTQCIMRSVVLATATLDTFTIGQIGWTDSDLDGIADILDTSPSAVMTSQGPTGSDPYRITVGGSASDVALDNKNVYGYGHDITLNTVAAVEWRVDSGGWSPASPTDGAWDEATEPFSFTSGALAPGVHVFQSRATNSVGNLQSPADAETVTIYAVTAVEPAAGGSGSASIETQLGLAVPNPTRRETEIFWTLEEADEATILLFDASGRLVRTLVSGPFEQGKHSARWDGRDDSGRPVASGNYFYRLDASEYHETRRLVLIN